VDIDSRPPLDRLETAWAAFAAVNLAIMFAFPDWETVPFHFIWISLTILYGVRVWNVRKTVVILSLVVVSTGAVMVRNVIKVDAQVDEVSEVPLMAAVFLAMVWHARRRELAVREVRRLANRERIAHERERAFVRFASHELRTPITVARGHAELAAMQVDDAQTFADLGIVVDELDRLSTLSSRLLTLASADAPTFLSKTSVNLTHLLQETVQRWQPTAGRDWSVDVRGSITLDADPLRLGVALDALIENAVAHTHDGARIVLRAFTAGPNAAIEVSDSGSGISPGQLAHAFEPFSRPRHTRDQATGGTGLGLAIVKAIVGAHDGTVTMSSTLDVGTTVRLELPLDDATTHHADGDTLVVRNTSE